MALPGHGGQFNVTCQLRCATVRTENAASNAPALKQRNLGLFESILWGNRRCEGRRRRIQLAVDHEQQQLNAEDESNRKEPAKQQGRDQIFLPQFHLVNYVQSRKTKGLSQKREDIGAADGGRCVEVAPERCLPNEANCGRLQSNKPAFLQLNESVCGVGSNDEQSLQTFAALPTRGPAAFLKSA